MNILLSHLHMYFNQSLSNQIFPIPTLQNLDLMVKPKILKLGPTWERGYVTLVFVIQYNFVFPVIFLQMS